MSASRPERLLRTSMPVTSMPRTKTVNIHWGEFLMRSSLLTWKIWPLLSMFKFTKKSWKLVNSFWFLVECHLMKTFLMNRRPFCKVHKASNDRVRSTHLDRLLQRIASVDCSRNLENGSRVSPQNVFSDFLSGLQSLQIKSIQIAVLSCYPPIYTLVFTRFLSRFSPRLNSIKSTTT